MATSTLSRKERDIQLLLAAGCHLGTKNLDHRMERYVHKRRDDGIHIINLNKTYEKLQLAARIIVAIENPQDIVANSARPYGHRAVFKFAQYLGCTSLAGRYTPGTFTNQIQKSFVEPRLLVVTDPRTDAQPVKESSYMNIPTIAFCDTDSPLTHVDVAIPTNNRGRNSLAVIYWLLCRMVLEMRGTITSENPWDVLPDMFLYRDPEEEKEGEEGAEEVADTGFGGGGGGGFATGAGDGGFGGGGFGFEVATGFESAAAPDAGGFGVAPGAADAGFGAPDAGGFGSGFEAAAAPDQGGTWGGDTPAAAQDTAVVPEEGGGGWGSAPASGGGGWS